MMRRAGMLLAFAFVAGLTAFASEPRLRKQGHLLATRDYAVPLPIGFTAPVVPSDNPLTREKIELGRHLFYDPRLSENGTQSCASCHQQARAFTDGERTALGSTGMRHFRNAMTLTNVAWRDSLTWADRDVTTLEAQALVPLRNEHPVELGFAERESELVDRLRDDDAYRARFAAAFPDEVEPVTLENLARAIASFERTLISGRSPYDRLLFGDDPDALSDSAKRGLRLFVSERLGCAECHGGRDLSTPVGGDAFRRNGLTRSGERWGASDLGLASRSGLASDEGRFRVPTLRNVAVTAPYMHDGSILTLSEVIDGYSAGDCGSGRAEIRAFSITSSEKSDLLAFLESLTDEEFLRDPSLGDPAEIDTGVLLHKNGSIPATDLAGQ